MTDVALALDAGGTKLLAGLVTRDGTVVLREQVPTPRDDRGCDPGLRSLAALAGRVRDRAGAAGCRVVTVGAGMPEYVLDGLLTSTEVFAWTRQPGEVLAGLGVPVTVESDVRCAAVAEASARTEVGSLLYVSWGTGLSSTLVVDGRVLAGCRGEAIALGEWPVAASVDPRWPGTLETYASGRGIAQRRERPGADAETVEAGAATAVAHAVAALVQVLDPEVVVLGGGIGTSGGRLPADVRDAVPGLLGRACPPPVEPARTGADAGLLGAALVAWEAV
jgi:glucokinase